MECFYRHEHIRGCTGHIPSLVESEHDIWNKFDHRNHERRDMGSGEADAIRTSLDSVTNTVHTVNIDTGSNTGGTYGYYGWGSTTPYVWSYTTTVYKYQVKCPVKLCKKMNWLELDKITPCSKCGAKLKAVSEQADFEIEVE